MTMEIKIGADPELFVKDAEGRFVSGHDLIPGTKKRPFGVLDGAIQVDGVACEFNIYPAKTADEFLRSLRSVQSQMQDMISEKRPGLVLVAEPTAMFEEDYFEGLPFEALLLGCEPDFNAYTGRENPKPVTNLPMRTGAGHIHIGWTSDEDPMDEDHFEMCREVVRQLDATLYPKSLEWDDDTRRQKLYGRPGSFRPKHYGVEYRPLSNAFLRSDDTVRLVFDTAYHSVLDYFEGYKYSDPELEKQYA